MSHATNRAFNKVQKDIEFYRNVRLLDDRHRDLDRQAAQDAANESSWKAKQLKASKERLSEHRSAADLREAHARMKSKYEEQLEAEEKWKEIQQKEADVKKMAKNIKQMTKEFDKLRQRLETNRRNAQIARKQEAIEMF